MGNPAPAAPPAAAPVDTKAPQPGADAKKVEGAEAAGDQKPPEGMTAAEKRAWKLAVNGKEQELDISGIDFKDPKAEERLKKLVQKGLGADEKFQQSAKIEKMLEQFIHLLKTDPKKVLEHKMIGHNMREFAEKYLADELARERMDPKDRELEEHKSKLREAEEKLKAEQDEKMRAHNDQLRQHYSQEYSKDIIETLKTSGLPQSPRTVQRIAHYMYEGLKRGVELRAADVVDLVKKDYSDDITSLFGSLDGDALLAVLGDAVADKIRKADLVRLKRAGNPVPKSEQPAGGTQQKPPQYKSLNDFDKLVSERI